MGDVAQNPPRGWLFALAAFCGAALIFAVEPMVAKLVLPLLGGAPMVWNTAMAFFQAALLAGYGYAHLLQRIASVKRQVQVHLAVLVLAALVLPLRLTGLVGEPSSTLPALWLLAVLALSVGAPFAAVAATAPLVQAWQARRGGEPYSLYVASNLGSLLALLAYPVIVEPLATLQGQRWGWSAGYGLFVLIMAALGLTAMRAGGAAPKAEAGEPVSWRQRLTWLALAAIPSSLMLGVTQHLATDVASAPFLWVAPLALYLATFIIAFQKEPLIPPGVALLIQGALLPFCAFLLPIGGGILLQFAVHLGTFFVTALVCHQALAARRPEPARLTEFYLWLSLGGVVGGAFNAFVAPVIFNSVIEYPLVLALACLVRPWGRGRLNTWETGVVVTGLLGALAAVVLVAHPPQHVFTFDAFSLVKGALAVAAVAAVITRRRALVFTFLVAVLSLAADRAGHRGEIIETQRSFFGVLRRSTIEVPGLGGAVRLLAHGTTLHGAQAQDVRYRCRPLVYYAPETPVGQVFEMVRQARPAIDIAAVGLGTGAVAAYTRPGDRLTFFEIDPMVVKLSSDPAVFSYTTECAGGDVDYVIGDARLTLARKAKGSYDILLVDAFSSDAIPAHLLTTEAMRLYLSRLKPNGLLILHLSNRHLELDGPALAAVRAADGYALSQYHWAAEDSPNLWESSEDAILAARQPWTLEPYRETWEIPPPTAVRAWTDDYTNLFGALVRRQMDPN